MLRMYQTSGKVRNCSYADELSIMSHHSIVTHWMIFMHLIFFMWSYTTSKWCRTATNKPNLTSNRHQSRERGKIEMPISLTHSHGSHRKYSPPTLGYFQCNDSHILWFESQIHSIVYMAPGAMVCFGRLAVHWLPHPAGSCEEGNINHAGVFLHSVPLLDC